jgi:heme/copper-type cytochrome/quinol oxidase subunit 2
MLDGITQMEGWWLGPLFLALWIVVGLLVYVLQQIRHRRKDEEEARRPKPEERMEQTLEAHRRTEEEERGERDQP